MCVNAPILAYYDKTKPIVLTVDSSSMVRAAAIMQEVKQFAYVREHYLNHSRDVPKLKVGIWL